MGRATRIMIAAAERHALDQQLVAHPGDVHGDAGLSAQAERPLLAAVGACKRRLQFGRVLRKDFAADPVAPHRLHCSGSSAVSSFAY